MQAKQVEYKLQILRRAPRQTVHIILRPAPDQAHKPCAKGSRDCVTAPATGRCRLNSPEEGEVRALWAQNKVLRRGKRQETVDAMVMGEVHRPTQAGETMLTPAIFEAGGSCLCIPRIKALQDGLRRGTN